MGWHGFWRAECLKRIIFHFIQNRVICSFSKNKSGQIVVFKNGSFVVILTRCVADYLRLENSIEHYLLFSSLCVLDMPMIPGWFMMIQRLSLIHI